MRLKIINTGFCLRMIQNRGIRIFYQQIGGEKSRIIFWRWRNWWLRAWEEIVLSCLWSWSWGSESLKWIWSSWRKLIVNWKLLRRRRTKWVVLLRLPCLMKLTFLAIICVKSWSWTCGCLVAVRKIVLNFSLIDSIFVLDILIFLITTTPFFPVVTVQVRSISLIKNAIDNRSCYLPSQVDDLRLNYSIRGVYSKRLLYNKYGIQLTL